MTSFEVLGLSVGEIYAESVAMIAMTCLFTPFGLPWLIIVDVNSLFRGLFEQLFKLMGVPVYCMQCCKKTHRAIRNK